MKRKIIAAIAVASLLLIGVGVGFRRHENEKSRRFECFSVLRSTGCALAMYCQDNGGQLPTDFSLMGTLISSPRLYVCPWNSKPPGSWTNINEWMDYYYVRWPSTTGVYAKYPLMYDRHLSNHGGKGINVLLVDVVNRYGGINGPIFWFWDPEAQWLRKFAQEHPETRVPLPEDLR